MTKDVKELEKKLKKATGEDKLVIKSLGKKKLKSSFNSEKFLKLAEEMKRIFSEDANNATPAIRS